MEIKQTENPADLEKARKLGYEPRDADPRSLVKFAFWMALVIAITMIAMRLMFSFIDRMEPLGPTMSPMVQETDRMLPPSPRLQTHPHEELQDYCAVQQKAVTTYGWVDQQTGVVHVPIDRAMDMVLARGLPARPAGEGNPETAALSTLPTVPDGTDLQGQCGYIVESPTLATGDDIAEPGK